MSITPEWQPRFTIEQVRAYTDAELELMSTVDLLEAQRIADKANDSDLAMKIFSKLPLAPESLLAAKISAGVDWIRKHSLNTTRAVELFGSDWLERGDEELFVKLRKMQDLRDR